MLPPSVHTLVAALIFARVSQSVPGKAFSGL